MPQHIGDDNTVTLNSQAVPAKSLIRLVAASNYTRKTVKSSLMTQVRKSDTSSHFGAFLLGNTATNIIRRRRRRKRNSRGFFSLVGCCIFSTTFICFVFGVFFSAPGKNYFSSSFWRSSHHTNPDIQFLQNTFPVHVGYDLESIKHPGFFFSDKNRLQVVLDGLTFSQTVQVPRFWNPSAYGENGVRDFLGFNGKYLISQEEARAIGSFMESKETIFVAVASYRDPECLTTVEDIFLRAKYPERIRVAIVDQRTEGDPLCSKPVESCEQNPEQVLCKYGHLIDSTEYSAQLMVGPVFARHLAYRMYRGEYFAMQVDSHVRFVANWDEDIIDQWKSTGNEMAIISTYLNDIANSIDSQNHESLRATRSIMCKIEYEWKGDSKEHIKYNIQPNHKPRIEDSPMLNPFWAAGFSFGRGHFVVQVPYDQFLPMVFQGEEISMTVRGFTYGYDFYAPVRNVAFHIYAIRENLENRKDVKRFTENESLFPGAKNEAYHRLNGIVGSGKLTDKYNHIQEDSYGLGNVRPRERFFQTFGIHTDTRHIENGLCDFVQGIGSQAPMHTSFTQLLRYDTMGIDYTRIRYAYVEGPREDTAINPAELAELRESLLRKRGSL
jgi:[Skp1-protein]-hydroxyproline N-acetylglucosaminyltransferase